MAAMETLAQPPPPLRAQTAYALAGVEPILDADEEAVRLRAGAAQRHLGADVCAALASRNVAAVAHDVARRAADKTVAMHCAPVFVVYRSALALVCGSADAGGATAVLSSYEATHAAQTLLEVLRDVKRTPGGLETAAVLANYVEIVARRTSGFERLVARHLPAHVAALRAGVREPLFSNGGGDDGGDDDGAALLHGDGRYAGISDTATAAQLGRGVRAAVLLRAYAVDMLRLLEYTLTVLLGVPAEMRWQLLTPCEAPPLCDAALLQRCDEQSRACALKRLAMVRRTAAAEPHAAAQEQPADQHEEAAVELLGARLGSPVSDALAFMFYRIADA